MAKAKNTKKSSTAKKISKTASAVSKIADAVTKKAETAKETAAKAVSATEIQANVVLQYADKDLSYETLVQNAKNVYQYDMGGDPESVKNIELFVKPEENKVYFVIDGKEGNYDL